MTVLEQKQRVYKLLQDGEAVAAISYVNEKLNKSKIKVTCYYNRTLGEITEENQGSFKKVTFKFVVTEELAEEMMEVRPEFNMINILSMDGDSVLGVLYTEAYGNNMEPVEADMEYTCELVFDE